MKDKQMLNIAKNLEKRGNFQEAVVYYHQAIKHKSEQPV